MLRTCLQHLLSNYWIYPAARGQPWGFLPHADNLVISRPCCNSTSKHYSFSKCVSQILALEERTLGTLNILEGKLRR
ncbi:hypothetical protein BDW74DRAFT_152282 [Aspergillus multicolor]|uniref:uncharacterized protein n=1 Tax=Aspergillus multicolor TaxID=41759 RepID=UPI003CCD7004